MRRISSVLALGLLCGVLGVSLVTGYLQIATTAPPVRTSADKPADVAAEEAIIGASLKRLRRELFEETIAQFASSPASFVVTVSSCTAEPDPRVGVRTACTVAVERTLHGAKPPARLVVRQEGGCLARTCVTAAHEPDLVPGMRAAIASRADSGGRYWAVAVIVLGPSKTVGPEGSSLDNFAAQIIRRRAR